MQVSVVIPTLNESNLIRQSVQSVRSAGIDDIIVADGGSTDGTREMAATLGCRVTLSAQGRGIQQNQGARLAQGDILLFLHADSSLSDGCLPQLYKAFHRSQVIGGAFEHHIDADGVLYRAIEKGNALRVRVFRMAYGDQAIFVHRQPFEQLGGFPSIPIMEDVQLMRRLRRRGQIVLLPGPIRTSSRRWQRHGILRQTICNWFLLAAEQVGISPNELARFYPSCP